MTPPHSPADPDVPTTPSEPAEPAEPAGPDGITRRLALGASAWSVPTVLLASSAPAFAASGLDLRLTPAARTLMINGTSGDYTAQVTGTPGAANAGHQVTVALPDGLTFASPGEAAGAQTHTFTTDVDGHASFSVTSDETVARTTTITASLASTPTASRQSVLTSRGVYGWGNNNFAQLGPDAGHWLTPRPIGGWWDAPEAVGNWGAQHAGLLAVSTDGYVYARGRNGTASERALGVGATGPENLPAFTPTQRTASQRLWAGPSGTPVRMHRAQTSALVSSGGYVWATGANPNNMYDLAGFSAHSGHWQQVGATIPAAQVAKFAVSPNGSAAWLLKNGDLWTSGSSEGGVRANRQSSGTHAPARARAGATGTVEASGLADVAMNPKVLVAIAASNNTVYVAGTSTEHGGNGLTHLTNKPMPGAKKAAKIFASMVGYWVVFTDGTVHHFGVNWNGHAGTGTTAPSGADGRQVVLPSGTTVTDIVTGGYGNTGTIFLTSTGEVYFAGPNSFGGRGDGTSGAQSAATPVKVEFDFPVERIAGSGYGSWYAYA